VTNDEKDEAGNVTSSTTWRISVLESDNEDDNNNQYYIDPAGLASAVKKANVNPSNATRDLNKLATERNQRHVSPYAMTGENVFFINDKKARGKPAWTIFGAVLYIMKTYAAGVTTEWKKTIFDKLVAKLDLTQTELEKLTYIWNSFHNEFVPLAPYVWTDDGNDASIETRCVKNSETVYLEFNKLISSAIKVSFVLLYLFTHCYDTHVIWNVQIPIDKVLTVVNNRKKEDRVILDKYSKFCRFDPTDTRLRRGEYTFFKICIFF